MKTIALAAGWALLLLFTTAPASRADLIRLDDAVLTGTVRTSPSDPAHKIDSTALTKTYLLAYFDVGNVSPSQTAIYYDNSNTRFLLTNLPGTTTYGIILGRDKSIVTNQTIYGKYSAQFDTIYAADFLANTLTGYFSYRSHAVRGKTGTNVLIRGTFVAGGDLQGDSNNPAIIQATLRGSLHFPDL